MSAIATRLIDSRLPLSCPFKPSRQRIGRRALPSSPTNEWLEMEAGKGPERQFVGLLTGDHVRLHSGKLAEEGVLSWKRHTLATHGGLEVFD